jgi:hypothetical protein
MDILNLLFVNMMIKQFIVSEVNTLLMETLYKEKSYTKSSDSPVVWFL